MQINKLEERLWEFISENAITAFFIMFGQVIAQRLPAENNKATLGNPDYAGHHFVVPVVEENGNIIASYPGQSFIVPEKVPQVIQNEFPEVLDPPQ